MGRLADRDVLAFWLLGLAYISTEGYTSRAPGFSEGFLADWYVYQHDGDPLGPWSTDTVASAILAGKLAPDVWVAAPGSARWTRALDVPVIGQLVDGLPTRPRRDSGMRMVPGAFTASPEDADAPLFGATMMMVTDDEVELTASPSEPHADAPPTTRMGSNVGALDERGAPLAHVVTRESPVRAPMPPAPALATPTPPAAKAAEAAPSDNGSEDVPATDRALPPSSSTPSLPPGGVRTETRETAASTSRGGREERKRRNG